MALALNNLKRVYMPLNKETKPNLDPLHFAGDRPVKVTIVKTINGTKFYQN